MEDKKWIIGNEYEFSFDGTNWVKLKLIYIKSKDIAYNYLAISSLEVTQGFPYIREIQQEVIEPRFIETDIENNGTSYLDVYVTRYNNEIILLSDALANGAIGFKFEGKERIYNNPIQYIDCGVICSLMPSNSKDVKIIRANKVVWLNPKYKE